METSEPRSQSDSSMMSPKELASTCRSEEAVEMREGGKEGKQEGGEEGRRGGGEKGRREGGKLKNWMVGRGYKIVAL